MESLGSIWRKNLTSLVGEWTVPPIPATDNSQLLYFWNGIEPNDNAEVLQPVLQFGSSPIGGGDFWALASWFVSNDGTVVTSSLINVNVGDVITGTMTLLSNGSWIVTGTDNNIKNSTGFTYEPSESDYDYAYEVLEAYSLSGCNDYPSTGKVLFTNIAIEVLGKPVSNPTWTTMTKDTTCNEKANVVSPTSVFISFDTS